MDTSGYDLGQISLLIVEDEADPREMLARMITMKYPHMRTFLAENGQQGIDLFFEHHPDIILADMNMPVVDGIQMARQIRSADAQATIIAVTAHNDPSYLLSAIETGIRHYVLKPVDGKQLFEAIDKNVEEIRLKRLVREQDRQIRMNEHQLSEAQKITHLGSWEWDLASGRMRWSDELYRIMGIDPSMTSPTFDDLLARISPADRAMVRAEIRLALENRHSLASQYWHIRRPDGSERIILCKAEILLDDASGNPVSLIGTAHDLTERRLIEEERMRLAAIVESSNDAIVAADLQGIITCWNKGAQTIFGYTAEEAQGKGIGLIVPPDRLNEVAHIRQTIASGREVQHYETVRIRKDGRPIDVSLTASPIKDLDGKVVGVSAIARDVTERRKMEQIIEYQAHHDALTDLPNRQLFLDFLALELAQARRNGKKLALLFLDLNGFKQINDTMGHIWGDRLLQEVARRLRSCIRESDTVARLGGDEFTVLMPDLGQTDDVGIVLRKILGVFETPFMLNDVPVNSATSIGISMFPDDGDTCDDLMKKADIAMYDAKGAGRNGYQFYNAEINARTVRGHEIEKFLRQAVFRGELEILFQPMVRSASRQVTGAEVLLRWHHPRQGLLLPDQFLPIAENSGAIVSIGEWVLRSACEKIRLWQQRGVSLNISINLSNRQFHQPNLLEKISAIVEETRFDPRLLMFEVSENALMNNIDFSCHAIRSLAEMGIGMAIDNFGSGSSSLRGLRRMPIHTIKIDRHFVGNMLSDPEDLALVNAVIAMSHNLKMRVVASGVENEQQFTAIQQSGCDELQGFLISQPLPSAAFERFVGL